MELLHRKNPPSLPGLIAHIQTVAERQKAVLARWSAPLPISGRIRWIDLLTPRPPGAIHITRRPLLQPDGSREETSWALIGLASRLIRRAKRVARQPINCDLIAVAIFAAASPIAPAPRRGDAPARSCCARIPCEISLAP